MINDPDIIRKKRSMTKICRVGGNELRVMSCELGVGKAFNPQLVQGSEDRFATRNPQQRAGGSVPHQNQMCLLILMSALLLIFIQGPPFISGIPSAACQQLSMVSPELTPELTELDSALCIRDMDINTLLRALAMKYKVNIVSTPDVAGRISLNLKQAGLEDTLTAISKTMGLVWAKEGSVYILGQREPGQSFQPSMTDNNKPDGGDPSAGSEGGIPTEQSSRKEAEKKQDDPNELRVMSCELGVGKAFNPQPATRNPQQKDDPKAVKIFHINYADITELSKVIQWSFEKIRTTAYTRESMILVEGNDKELSGVEGMIRSLDIPPRQALIEAQILEINLSDDLTYGIDWSGTFSHGQNTDGLVTSPGSWFPPGPKPGDSSSQFLFGILRPHFAAKLSALEKKGDVKTLAKPRIMVLDGKSAQILIGGKLGYYLTTTTETSTLQSVEFLDIGTQLKLVPHIAEDGNILMDIQPEVSDGSLSSGLPQKTTTSVITSVMVKAGETIFIGGLIRSSEIKGSDRLPILGHIPVLGRLLFSKASNQTQRKELIILLTPYLVPSSQEPVSAEKASPDALRDEIGQWQEKIDGLEKSQ